VRLRRHQPTRDYMARRLTEGKTKTEVMRCLKRYIARSTRSNRQFRQQKSLPEYSSICYRGPGRVDVWERRARSTLIVWLGLR
jgi:hypothetical protein